MSDANRVNEDSVVGEEVGMVERVTEDSMEGEDARGGGEEGGWKGFWEKCIASTAVSLAANALLIENWVNTESRLDEDEADERQLLPWIGQSRSGSGD